jgi:hypothetical protein
MVFRSFTLPVVGGSDHEGAHVNAEFSELVPDLEYLSRVGRNYGEGTKSSMSLVVHAIALASATLLLAVVPGC